MNRAILLIVGVLFGIGLNGTALGQRPIAMPDGSPLPRKAIDNGQKKGWVTFGGLYPLSEPTKRKENNPSQRARNRKPFGFMQKKYTILREAAAADGKPFALLGSTQGGLVTGIDGWIEKKYFLERKRAMQDPETTIPLKAMIVTPEDIIQKAASGLTVAQEAKIYAGPNKIANKVAAYEWFSYHFIYDKQDDYVLIGSAESFSPFIADNQKNNTVKGWVHESNICEWNTREAFWWDHTTAKQRKQNLGNIFQYATQAYDRKNPLFTEVFSTDSPSPFISRFPRLTWDSNPKTPAVDHKTGFHLHHVGWISSKGVDNQEAQKFQKRLVRLQKDLNKIDILFLIDDTLSMYPWFDVARKIVNEINRRVGGDQGSLEVRIAVSYFNDLDKKTGAHDPRQNALAPLGSQAANRQLAELAIHQENGNVQADPAEMLFDGMKHAITRAGFNPDAYKLMVVIGTHPDKSAIETAQDTGPNDWKARSQRSGRDVVNKLDPDRLRPIELYAIQVVDADNQDKKKYKPQIEGHILTPFRNRHTKGLAGTARYLGGFYNSRDPDDIQKKVLGRFKRQQDENHRTQEQLKAAIRGRWNTQFSPDILARFKRQGIDVEKLKSSQVLFRRGFVWEQARELHPARVPQLRPWVLMSEKELTDLRDMLNSILRGVRGKRQGKLSDLVQQEIAALVGSKWDPKWTPKEILKKKKGLIVSSELLSLTFDELDEGPSKKAIEELERKRNVLTDILDGKQSHWDRDGGRRIIASKNRIYTIPGSPSNWYWLDVQRELP